MCAMMEKLRMNSRSMRYDCAVGASVTCLHRLSHMSYSNIRFEVGDFGLALLTVNRPEKLNALNAETVLELRDAVARAATDAEVRAQKTARQHGAGLGSLFPAHDGDVFRDHRRMLRGVHPESLLPGGA